MSEAPLRPAPVDDYSPEDEELLEPPADESLGVLTRDLRYPRRTYDDIGNAERLVDHYGAEVRFTVDAEQWVTYEEGRWSFKGGATRVWQRVIRTIDALPTTEATTYSKIAPVGPKGEELPSPREKFLQWAGSQRMRAKLAAMREIAQGHPALHCFMNDFDRHEMLLNVGNGVVDLRTGKLLDHDPGLFLMQQSPIHFEQGAKAPMWEQFLASVMPDEERRAYLARVVGYTLTGSTEEQVMFIHHGDGQNGKGVFMRVVTEIFGDYAQSVPRSTLMAKQNEGIPNDVARMMGKRLLSTTETSAGKRLDDELVKQLTGEDTVSARFLNKEFFDFRPVGKIHLVTNYLPTVGGGHGIARRLQDIGWDVIVPPEKRIKKYDEKILAAESSGVLNWAIQGCLDWQKNGLAVPAAVREKTKEHLAKSEPLLMWLDEYTRPAEPTTYTETGTLFANYKRWCQDGSLREMSIRAFGDALAEKGYKRGNHPTNRRSVIHGLEMAPSF
ncbi:phage/plasmid primase, P4 family [Streptomyces sp. NBC_00096]|uniref:DNA primase family protein n=1 Tax=Streptomyces sp. NBC_00096 TaxID=2975650 RepID=UPI003248E8B4